MNHFDSPNGGNQHDEHIQIVDLDPKEPYQKRYTEVMLTALGQGLAKPWGRFTLIGVLLLILLSTMFIHYYKPFDHPISQPEQVPNHTSTEDTGVIIMGAASPADTSFTSKLLQLQNHPLHFPKVAVNMSCPTSPKKHVNTNFGIAQGDGPVYASVGEESIKSPAVMHYLDGQNFTKGGINTTGWGGEKVLWFVKPAYKGLVLVRGQQLDGPHAMRFSEGAQPIAQQFVIDPTLGGSPWPNTSSYVRLQAPGCYAYQIDGENFSYVIVFQAVVLN